MSSTFTFIKENKKILLLALAFVAFLSFTPTTNAQTVPCQAPDQNKQCGFISYYNLGNLRCDLAGPGLNGQGRILGGQVCVVGGTGDSAGNYNPSGATSPYFPLAGAKPDGWTYTKSAQTPATIPNGFWSDGYPYNNYGFYGGTADLSLYSSDDTSTMQVGSHTYARTGCTCNPSDIFQASCPSQNLSGNSSISVAGGEPISLSVTNMCRPSDGNGLWGVGEGNVTLNNVTYCYTAAMLQYLNNNGESPRYNNVVDYRATANGVCTPVSPAPAPISITVTSRDTSGNLLSSSWNISGPVNLSGSGSSQTYSNQPRGTYTISPTAPSNYTLQSVTPNQSQTLNSDGSFTIIWQQNPTTPPPPTPGTPAGDISASPTTCTVTSGSTCSSNITWTSSNTTAVRVYVSDNGGAESLSGSSGSGNGALSPQPNWIGLGHVYIFRLYDYSSGNRGTTLDSVSVTASASPTPGPTPTPPTPSPTPGPVNGVCGTANGLTFPNSASSYSPYTQCAAGTSNNTSFPTAGNSVVWDCLGQNGGTNSGATCSASRAATTACTPPNGTITLHPASVSPGGLYEARCDYGSANDYIPAPNRPLPGCSWPGSNGGHIGSVATFACIAPVTPGSYQVTCKAAQTPLLPGFTNFSCDPNPTNATLTVAAPPAPAPTPTPPAPGPTPPPPAPSQYDVQVAKTTGGTVTATDNSIICGGTCTNRYSAGTTVTLKAKPFSIYWKFSGWSGDCSGTGDCILIVNGPKSVTATFIAVPFKYQEF